MLLAISDRVTYFLYVYARSSYLKRKEDNDNGRASHSKKCAIFAIYEDDFDPSELFRIKMCHQESIQCVDKFNWAQELSSKSKGLHCDRVVSS